MFELYEYWREFPPAHECLKGAYRLEARETSSERPPADGAASAPSGPIGDFSDLVKQFPNGIL